MIVLWHKVDNFAYTVAATRYAALIGRKKSRTPILMPMISVIARYALLSRAQNDTIFNILIFAALPMRRAADDRFI